MLQPGEPLLRPAGEAALGPGMAAAGQIRSSQARPPLPTLPRDPSSRGGSPPAAVALLVWQARCGVAPAWAAAPCRCFSLVGSAQHPTACDGADRGCRRECCGRAAVLVGACGPALASRSPRPRRRLLPSYGDGYGVVVVRSSWLFPSGGCFWRRRSGGVAEV